MCSVYVAVIGGVSEAMLNITEMQLMCAEEISSVKYVLAEGRGTALLTLVQHYG